MKKDFETLMSEIKNNTSPELKDAFTGILKEQKFFLFFFTAISTINAFFAIYGGYTLIVPFSLKTIIFSLICFTFFEAFIYIVLLSAFDEYTSKHLPTFKIYIIKNLLNNFYNDIIYMPHAKMQKSNYDEANYNEQYNIYKSDDYVEALLNNKNPMQMAEVHTIEEETIKDVNGNYITTSTTKFHGLFSKIEIGKSIFSELHIMKNRSITKKDKLSMDSHEFEKLFDVSATNKIIGMQLLTHDIMELLVNFKRSTGITFDVSIINNFLYLRFHTGEMFEFKILKSNKYNVKRYKKYYNVLDFTYTLSNMLIELIEKTEI